MKKIILSIILVAICMVSFLVGNYFYIRGQYKDMYLNCLSQKYDINDIEIEEMVWSFKDTGFNCRYKQKSTGQRFVASLTASKEKVIEYTYASSGNLIWNDAWDIPMDSSQNPTED